MFKIPIIIQVNVAELNCIWIKAEYWNRKYRFKWLASYCSALHCIQEMSMTHFQLTTFTLPSSCVHYTQSNTFYQWPRARITPFLNWTNWPTDCSTDIGREARKAMGPMSLSSLSFGINWVSKVPFPSKQVSAALSYDRVSWFEQPVFSWTLHWVTWSKHQGLEINQH